MKRKAEGHQLTEVETRKPKGRRTSADGGAGLEVVVGEILAVGRELVVNQVGENLLELKEEPFTWSIAVGEHPESDSLFL